MSRTELCNENYQNCEILQRQKRALLDSLRAPTRTANFKKITKTAKFCKDVRGRRRELRKLEKNCDILQRQKRALLDSLRAPTRTANFTKITKITIIAKFCKDRRGPY